MAKHAVVVGGGIAGLLAARVLSDHFPQVTVIDRDNLPNTSMPRKGTSQADHIHQLLVHGMDILSQLFPGIDQLLLQQGAHQCDFFNDALWFNPAFGWGPRFPSDFTIYTCTRHLLEWCVRHYVQRLPGVSFVQGHDVVALLGSATVVCGVRAHPRGAQETSAVMETTADLVIDASGRDSSALKWLTALGHLPPRETIVNPFLGYASRYYEPRTDLAGDWKLVWVLGKPPTLARQGAIFPVEGNRWLVSLFGSARDYPPTDEGGFLEFVRGLGNPVMYDILKDATPCSPIRGYRRTETKMRHYEQMKAQPAGFLAMGDAVCALNPFYGQGMTVAAMGALVLDQCLREVPDPARLPAVFQQRLAGKNKTPWLMSTAADSVYPSTEGIQANTLTKMAQWYINKAFVLGATNSRVYRDFMEVMHLRRSPLTLFSPSIVGAVLASMIASSPLRHTEPPLLIKPLGVEKERQVNT